MGYRPKRLVNQGETGGGIRRPCTTRSTVFITRKRTTQQASASASRRPRWGPWHVRAPFCGNVPADAAALMPAARCRDRRLGESSAPHGAHCGRCAAFRRLRVCRLVVAARAWLHHNGREPSFQRLGAGSLIRNLMCSVISARHPVHGRATGTVRCQIFQNHG